MPGASGLKGDKGDPGVGLPGAAASVGSQVSGVKMAALARRDPEDLWDSQAAGGNVGRRVTLEPQG